MDSNQNANSASATQSTGIAAKNMPMGILAYIGPLVIIPLVTVKNDPFVKFHTKQGLVLLVIEVAVWMLGTFIMSPLWMVLSLVNLATLILSIIGIINVVNGNEKELPVVGKFSSYFKF